MTSTKPSVHFTLPTFGVIPDSLPQSLPPPVHEGSFRAPFGIDAGLYNAVLRPEIPLTFATLYVVSVFSLNAYNRRRNHKPWWVARQPFFHWFVVIHNALLTIYSAATFLAMFRAIVHTLPSWDEGTGTAGIADALCKMHGPRGLGDAATYNTTINIWEVKNTFIKLGYNGNPDPTDVGRLWNEGLAFWGWMFYVSKFYEVLDTAIILAKGKRSPTLQTYHHGGAMLCMWAGIRYMSPPIWMFVFVNSFIHALMYTYFTLAAIRVKVPITLKRTLTTMQIVQFVWGTSYAAAHLFIKYDIPVSTPYQVASVIKSAASSVSSAATEATSAVSSVIASPVATGTMVAFIKKMLLRAVGEEGIAERVTVDHGSFAQQYMPPQIEEKLEKVKSWTQPQYETRWRSDLMTVNCIDTSGEAFAIYLNLLYLAPLTFLFARFFIKAYTGRGKPRSASHATTQVKQSGEIAVERTGEAVEGLGKKGEDIIEKEAKRAKLSTTEIHDQLRKDVQAMKNGTWGRERRNPDGSAIDDAAQEALRSPQASGESASKQEDVLAATASTRPGASTEGSKGDIPSGFSTLATDLETRLASNSQEDDRSYSEVVQEGTSSQSYIQSSSMTASSFTDTDAMGKSGVDVEYTTESGEKVGYTAEGDDGRDFGQRDFGERDFPPAA